LRGDTNIKFLVNNGCHIWDGDAYKAYLKKYEKDKLHGVIYEDNETHNRPFYEDEFINWVKNNDKFSELYGDLGPVYGKQWRNWEHNTGDTWTGMKHNQSIKTKIDQIANLIQDLKTNPDSRRLMVTAWNPAELDQMTLPPCHYGFQVYTRELSAKERTALGSKGSTRLYDSIKEGNYTIIDADTEMHKVCDEIGIPKRAISLMWNQRSVDSFLGLPFNIASYGLLLEIIAAATNMVPDELIGNLGDVHLYSNHIDQALEQIGREPYPLPTLNINTEFWPTESGECGIGPIDAIAVFNGFSNDHFCKCLLEEDLQLANYQSHPTIKAPLSN
jgi:thymidylate synthase